MIKQTIDAIKDELAHVLYLELDDFKLEILHDEVISRFIGLRLRSEFQAVFDVSQSEGLLGYEAYLRPATGIEAVTPSFAFGIAEHEDKLVKLDRIARTLHMLNYLQLPDDKGFLFLNVHPKLLTKVSAHGRVFEQVLHRHSVPTRQVVIEIIENGVEADSALKEAVDNYRDRGYQIAIDGFGSQHSNLDRLWQLSPHFVKLDLSIIRRAQANAKIKRSIPKLLDIIHSVGAQPIVTGIENEVQLDLALDAGAKLLQGYFLQKPASVSSWTRPLKARQDSVLMPGAPVHFGSFSAAAQYAL